jgi:hypothetical protein
MIFLSNNYFIFLTRKKFSVEPLLTHPYFISVCLLRSSTLLIDDCIRCTVKNAAKLAVYDETINNVKNAQIIEINLTDGEIEALIFVPYY